MRQETSLHAALKDWYTQADDRQEVPVDGFLIDVVRGDELVEIQTRNFTALKSKLPILLNHHPVRLVHPIAVEKWIVHQEMEGQPPVRRRKSPRRGRLEHLFLELVRIPHLVSHPNLTIEIVLIREEELRRNDGRGSWRRKGWSIVDRRLLEIVDRVELASPADFVVFIPPDLDQPFTVRDLARSLNLPDYLAGKAAYCLRIMGLLELTGKRGRAILYTRLSAENYPQQSL
jgi:hypothetical protein